jgi:hypothetical protein
MMWTGAVVGGLLWGGCIPDRRASRDRANFGSSAGRVTAPEQDRCQMHGASSVRGPCDEAMYLAQAYVRKLAPGDQVCLEDLFGEEPAAACKARAAVKNVGTDLVLLEIRSPRPDSRWYQHQMAEIWFEEGALVDLYLAERGF